jgi:pyrimidine-nucleoside phosphorylase
MTFSPATLIAKKRDGGEHHPTEIHALIEGFQDGSLADYQMTAWLMAVYLNGLSDGEMTALTKAMLHSGRVLNPRRRNGAPRIDKHSTGGVGDKISLPLAAIAAACGLHVPMISGRGLGHTGGTLDKLESIPGYDTQLSIQAFERTVAKCGASIIGQTTDIAPADKRIYALRDVTGTVACRPLIVASILSKKLAAALDGLVLDVKVGRGAFMKDRASASALAKSLVQVSTKLGTPAVARLTRMEEPLGRTIGNALEVRESIEILRGEGPMDTTELTLTLASEMLLLAKVCHSRSHAMRVARAALTSGAALERFAQMVELHGGNARVVERTALLPKTRFQVPVHAPQKGFVQHVDALALALLALELGAGRKRAEDKVDHAVGLEIFVQVGDRIEKGDLVAKIHTRKHDPHHSRAVLQAIGVGAQRVERPPLLVGRAIR